ncbi:MAG TPA: DNA polymerase, partial [Bacteroidia bacterium]
ALEKIKIYLYASPFVMLLGAIRDKAKKIQILKTSIDEDSRYRTSYNIAGTDTGRFSSSLSEFGTGGNLQNIEEDLRRIFIADKGKKLAYLDAAQGESRVVGAIEWNLFKDETYLNACESGDLHTDVARLCWPNLGWKGDLKRDRELAEKPYYRHYSRRFMCKKLGHGSNYGGKAKTLADQSKIEVNAVEQFQEAYFRIFPVHFRWHAHVEKEIRTKGELVSLMGRKRQFWGRRDNPDTIREALAYDPQGSLADIVNTGMLQLWKSKTAQLLMNVHDAVVVQYREEEEDEIIPQLRKQLEYEVPLKHGRSLIIPYDCKTGWNYGMMTKENPDGLKEYAPGDKRERQEEVQFMDRPVRRV